ncbi:tail protein X [Streptomyces anulatus]|uniref:tail protein X n=1 Tax=Streptomyces anulatus TaxID=1892 RepID=UPI0034138C57
MAISLTSRYQRHATALVRDRRGNLQLAVMSRAPENQSLRVSDYRWRSHERVDDVSTRYYGSETSWWMIAEANPRVLDWTQVPAGMQIMVPRGLA